MTLDVFALPSPTFGEVQVFTGVSLTSTRTSTTNAQWREWIKPRGASVVQIFVLGAGGGGGVGYPAGAGTQRQGGSGGGSGAQARATIPAMLLPDRLYIQTGLGGGGGVTGVRNGDNGGSTYVTVYPDTTADNVVVYAAGGSGANNGQSDGSGAAGAGGAVPTLANMPVGGASVYNLLGGQAGAAGGSYLGGAGTSITPPTTGLRCMGGAGGAGVWIQPAAFAGGGFTPPVSTYLAEQAPPASGASVAGVAGLIIWTPLTMWGGGGGGSSYAGIAGAGGDGGYGSGGGGGGGGVTAGAAGSGGGGLVLISTW
jgi:hypothetical protein